jgi:hypothetical protein
MKLCSCLSGSRNYKCTENTSPTTLHHIPENLNSRFYFIKNFSQLTLKTEQWRMRPSRKIKLENVKLCFALTRLCENEGGNMVWSAACQLVPHHFYMTLLSDWNSSFLVRDLFVDARIKLKLIVNTVKGCKIIWFKTGIFLFIWKW